MVGPPIARVLDVSNKSGKAVLAFCDFPISGKSTPETEKEEET